MSRPEVWEVLIRLLVGVWFFVYARCGTWTVGCITSVYLQKDAKGTKLQLSAKK